jgi:hypothetical protein
MPSDERHDFFEQCKKVNKAGKLALVTHRKRMNHDEKLHSDGSRGQFLPEGVLKQQGFDVDRIKLNSPPEDVIDSAKLGKCYRVDIKVSNFDHTKGTRNESSLICDDDDRREPSISDVAMASVTSRKNETKEAIALRKKRVVAVKTQLKAIDKVKSILKVEKCPACLLTGDPLKQYEKSLKSLNIWNDEFDDLLDDIKKPLLPFLKSLKAYC